MDPDGLPANSFFKVTSVSIALTLSIIFNLSLQSGIIPDIWKHASVDPVFKKGSPRSWSHGVPCNYRPISLTCIACNLMEAGIKDALLVILRENKIINASQHGFMVSWPENRPLRTYSSVIRLEYCNCRVTRMNKCTRIFWSDPAEKNK